MDENRTGIPLPADLDAYEDEMESAILPAAAEMGLEPQPLLLPTLADAQRAAARVAYLRKKADELAALYDAEEQALLQQLEALRQRKADAVKPFERRMSWYLFALEQFHRERLAADPKEKTIRLPAGDLTMRAQQPEWNYGDEKALGDFLMTNYPHLVRPAPNKTELKKVATVRPDGTVVLPDGEIVPGITVVERPPKFDFKPA